MKGNVILDSAFNTIWDFKEIKMNKKLIIGIAFSLILFSGGFFAAQADCGGGCLSSISPCNWNLSFLSPCNWHFPSVCGFHCGSTEADSVSARDADRQDATRQGAYYRATTPAQMGSPSI